MALLPSKELLDGTKNPETTTGEFRLAMGNMRQYLSDLLGEDSTDKSHARETLGAAEKYCAHATGTGDAITASFDPEISQAVHNMIVYVRAKQANTSAVPSFRAGNASAIDMVKGNNRPLLAGDIAGEGHWLELRYDDLIRKWVLQNPASGVVCPSGVPVGAIGYFAMQTPPAGYLKADGSAVLRATYPDLFAAIGTTFGEGDGASTFNLPDLMNRFAQGHTSPGQKIEAGLPNITGNFSAVRHGNNAGPDSVDGAIRRTGVFNAGMKTGNADDWGGIWIIDASYSSGIYGRSQSVQPPALTLLPCIRAFDAYSAVQTGISVMNAPEISSRAVRATIEPPASKAWVNFDASSGEITIRNASHVEKVIRVEKGVFDIIFDESVQAECCTVTASSSALISAANLESFTGDYFPHTPNRVRVFTASGFPIQPVDSADVNVVVNQ